MFLSLQHWFEAEKFRGYEPALFEEVLMQPTIKEARKLATRNKTRWRFDWVKVRIRVLACGMVYASRADRGSLRWAASAPEIAQMLLPLGLPQAFLGLAAQEYVKLRDSPRVTFLGASRAPSDAVGKRINTIHRRHQAYWTLVHWQGRHGCWRVHDWALKQHLPVEYLGSDDARLTQAATEALADRCQSAVIFEAKGGKTMDKTLRAIRAQRKAAVEIDLYDLSSSTSLGA